MSYRKELILLILSDIFFINITWAIYYYIRVDSGLLIYATHPSFLAPMIVIFFYWFIIFFIAGMYQHWFVRSRFDEFTSVFKSVSLGVFILFLTIYIDDTIKSAPVVSRFIILIYLFLLIFFVSLGRVIIRGFQIGMLQKGIGHRNTLIVGTNKRAEELRKSLIKFPKLGYRFIGFIGADWEPDIEFEIGKLSKIREVIQQNNITELIIAVEEKNKEIVLEVVKLCSDLDVRIYITPSLSDIMSGMARTHQIYGIPLIEVLPEIMTFRTKFIKRLIDIVFSIFILMILFPFLIAIALLIKLTSRGPVFYIQERVGREGRIFKCIKFRSMIANAEEEGPKWADRDDPRVTKIGRFMRRLRIDEIPQFINVIKNNMSIVGPRPEREYFVKMLMKEIPYYSKRLKIKPGITGWAQIKHTYDSSVDDVKVKLEYDFYYIENMSLTLDFKIMVQTLFTIVMMKGH